MKISKGKRLCRECGKRPALYKRERDPRARVKFRKDHDLCLQCFRETVDHNHAQSLQS